MQPYDKSVLQEVEKAILQSDLGLVPVNDGKILDPENGKEYRASFTPIDGGKKLEVRGYLGPFPSMSVDLMLPAAEKITLVLEGIGDDNPHVALDDEVKLVDGDGVERVDEETKTLVSYDEREVPFDLLVTIPLNMGADYVARSGLGNELNLVPVDKHTLLSKKHDDIWALGDANDIRYGSERVEKVIVRGTEPEYSQAIPLFAVELQRIGVTQDRRGNVARQIFAQRRLSELPLL